MQKYRIKKILFVSPPFKSFIEKDYEILRKKFRVQNVKYCYEHKRSLLLLMPRIIRGTLWADVTYSWFGSFHAFFTVLFSRLLHRRSVVVAGGYDVAKMPEIDYGLMNMRLWRLFPILSFKLCDKILAVSQCTRKELTKNLNVDLEKVEVVVHGFDKNKFYPEGKKKNIVITVGRAGKMEDDCKGLTTFVKAAQFLPDVSFHLIGNCEKGYVEQLRRINSSNVSYVGFIPQEQLVKFMRRAKVYVQISAHESFGCALAEAMLCECIPVVTNRGAIREVVADTGYFVPYCGVEATAEAIKRALGDDKNKGKKARKRIEETFPIQEREKKLIEIIMRLHR